MSTHKDEKVRSLQQSRGLLRTGTGQNAAGDLGTVSQYSNAGTTTYTGMFRNHTTTEYSLFDLLTATPFAADAVNTGGAGYSLALLNLLAAKIGQLSLSAGSITTSSGALNIQAASGSNVTLGSATSQVLVTQSPSQALGIATKGYVDGLLQGFVSKAAVVVRTTADLASIAGGLTIAGSGATKTLTSTTNQTIASQAAVYFDGYATPTVGDRILVANQALAYNNGIYQVTSIGSVSTPWQLQRTLDANITADFTNGAFVYVETGTANSNSGWILQGPFYIFALEDPTNGLQTWTLFTKITNGIQLSASSGSGASTVANILQSNSLNFRAITAGTGTNATQAIELIENSSTVSMTFDQTKITGTGVLTSGSIASGFGAITTLNAVTAGSFSTSSLLTFTGATTANQIKVPSNLAVALQLLDQSANAYIKLVSTTGSLAVQIAQPLVAQSSVTVATSLGVTGPTTLGSILSVTAAATLNSTLAVTGAATLSSTLAVTGAAQLSSTLAVTGLSTLAGIVVPAGGLTFTGATGANFVTLVDNLANALEFKDVTTSTSFLKFVTTAGSQSMVVSQLLQATTLAVSGPSTLSGAVTANSTIQVTGTATLNGAVNANSTLAVIGASTFAGAVTASSTLAVTGTSTLTGAVTAGSSLQVTGDSALLGGQKLGVTSVNANTTLVATQASVVNVTTGSSVIVITLPDATAQAGRVYKFAKVDGAVGTVAITPAGVDTIDGDTTAVILATQYDYTRITSHGALGWFLH